MSGLLKVLTKRFFELFEQFVWYARKTSAFIILKDIHIELHFLCICWI